MQANINVSSEFSEKSDFLEAINERSISERRQEKPEEINERERNFTNRSRYSKKGIQRFREHYWDLLPF